MTLCFFVSDLHGDSKRYARLFEAIAVERPAAVFLGGDLLPSFRHLSLDPSDFFADTLVVGLRSLRAQLGSAYPQVFVILGNDDPRACESEVQQIADDGLWYYVHNRHLRWMTFDIYGYACVPPTPFLNKDWERYDVARYVDPGCVSPEEGYRSVSLDKEVIQWSTIRDDLDLLFGDATLEHAICLFHTPPYDTNLDRAALDGRKVDHVPLDVHVGSIAVRRFIEARQPLVTLHGHIHESARLTDSWRDAIGRTHMFSAAHDGAELSLVRLDLDDPAAATRELLPTIA